MRVRRSWLLLGMLLIPSAARADDHRADRFAAFSRAGGSSLFGVHLTDAVTLPNTRSKDLTLLGDISVHFGSPDQNVVTRVTALGGLRWTWAKDLEDVKDPKLLPKLLPFAHFLAGGVYTNNGAASDTDPAVGFGVGLDWVPKRGAARQAWATRVQVDYIVTSDDKFSRFSLGLVYRFKN